MSVSLALAALPDTDFDKSFCAASVHTTTIRGPPGLSSKGAAQSAALNRKYTCVAVRLQKTEFSGPIMNEIRQICQHFWRNWLSTKEEYC